LSDELPLPTLGGIVGNIDQRSELDIAMSVELHDDAIDWALQAVAVAARVHAAEAMLLSQSGELGRVGLAPLVDVDAAAPVGLMLGRGNILRDEQRPNAGPFWEEQEISESLEVLKARIPAQVVWTSGGFLASIKLASWGVARSTCTLDVKADHRDPLFGEGLEVVLRTPVPGTPFVAMALNEREVGSHGRGHALGGWWASTEGLLRHRSFYPNAIYQTGVMPQLLLPYARRAGEADDLMTRRRP
jgi:hypothetical protein